MLPNILNRPLPCFITYQPIARSHLDKLAVEGTYNEGVKVRNNGWIVINHDVWKNAVVFETYQGDELRYAAIVELILLT